MLVVVLFALWIVAAVILAHKRHAPVLWKRAAIIGAFVYCGGAFLQFWSWKVGMPPVDAIKQWVIHGLGG